MKPTITLEYNIKKHLYIDDFILFQYRNHIQINGNDVDMVLFLMVLINFLL